jgi:hypothetical protein
MKSICNHVITQYHNKQTPETMNGFDRYNNFEDSYVDSSKHTTTCGFSYKFCPYISVNMYTQNLEKAIDSVRCAVDHEQISGHYDEGMVRNVFGSFHFSTIKESDGKWFISANTGARTKRYSLICGVAMQLTDDQVRDFFTESLVHMNKYSNSIHGSTSNVEN